MAVHEGAARLEPEPKSGATANIPTARRGRPAKIVIASKIRAGTSYPADTPVPWFKSKVNCAKCGARGNRELERGSQTALDA
jgi:hypothetical protein